MAELIMTEEGSTPGTPATNKWKVYFKSNGFFILDDAGVETGPFGISSSPTGFMFGLTLSNNATDATNDIDVATGKCRDSGDAADIVLASALTKRLDAAWAVGTNQGGLDTGSIANATYHIWLIKRPDTGVVDALFSTSASAPTMPTNYTLKRRIGSILRESAAIVGFVQTDDIFMRKTPAIASGSPFNNPGTSAVLRTLPVPTGIKVEAILGVMGRGSAAAADNPGGIFITDPAVNDVAANTSAFNAYAYQGGAVDNRAGTNVRVYTNTSAQVRTRIEISTANTYLYITTLGWVDTRGKLA